MEGPDIREPLPPGCFCLWAPPARGLKGLLSFGRGSADGGERLKSLTRCEHQQTLAFASPRPPRAPLTRANAHCPSQEPI